jgi:hypothetical protein
MADHETTDADGKVYKYKDLDPADMLNLMEAAGANSGNQGWMRMAMLISSVKDIDGLPVPMPTNKNQVLSLARQVGNAGLVALNAAMFGDDETPDAAAVASGSEQLELAKN